MVDSHQGLLPEETQHSRGHRHAGERGTHAGSLGETDAVDITGGDPGFAEGSLDQSHDPGAMVSGGILGEKALAGRRDVGMSNIGEDLRGAAIIGMQHDAHAELVGGAFQTDGEHCDGAICGVVWSIYFFFFPSLNLRTGPESIGMKKIRMYQSSEWEGHRRILRFFISSVIDWWRPEV